MLGTTAVTEVFERNFFPFFFLFQSLLLRVGDQLLHQRSPLLSVSRQLRALRYFYLSDHRHRISIGSTVCQVFELLGLFHDARR